MITAPRKGMDKSPERKKYIAEIFTPHTENIPETFHYGRTHAGADERNFLTWKDAGCEVMKITDGCLLPWHCYANGTMESIPAKRINMESKIRGLGTMKNSETAQLI